MNVFDAAYNIGHDYPGGAEALAARMGIVPAVLRAKLNPNTNTNHVTLADAMKLQHLTNRTDIVEAMADDLGGVFMPMPTISDEDVTHAIRKAVGEFGNYMQLVDSALDDDCVTKNEARNLAASMIQMIARATHLQAMLQAMADK